MRAPVPALPAGMTATAATATSMLPLSVPRPLAAAAAPLRGRRWRVRQRPTRRRWRRKAAPLLALMPVRTVRRRREQAHRVTTLACLGESASPCMPRAVCARCRTRRAHCTASPRRWCVCCRHPRPPQNPPRTHVLAMRRRLCRCPPCTRPGMRQQWCCRSRWPWPRANSGRRWQWRWRWQTRTGSLSVRSWAACAYPWAEWCVCVCSMPGAC